MASVIDRSPSVASVISQSSLMAYSPSLTSVINHSPSMASVIFSRSPSMASKRIGLFKSTDFEETNQFPSKRIPFCKKSISFEDFKPEIHQSPRITQEESMAFEEGNTDTRPFQPVAEVKSRARKRCKGRPEEEVEVCTSVMKVDHMLIQARIGVRLEIRNELRLLNVSRGDESGTEHVVEGKERLRWNINYTEANTLQREDQTNVITLTDLKIFPKVGEQGGEIIVGNLEVHANGFHYASSCGKLQFSFLYRDVKQAFFRGASKMRPSFLHFHLRDPIVVGKEKRQDIQFHLVHIPVGHKRKRSKPERDTGRGVHLKNFVHGVEEKWRYITVKGYYPFSGAELHKKYEFQGNLPSKAPTVFCLTDSALVGLVDEPFVVVRLHEIEIVILKLIPASKPVAIDMTIALQDFKLDLVEINSIPMDKLDFIKDSFNSAMVKYYVTDQNFSWDSIVKGLADPIQLRRFVDRGGWPHYGVEDSHTLDYYKHFRGSADEGVKEGTHCVDQMVKESRMMNPNIIRDALSRDW